MDSNLQARRDGVFLVLAGLFLGTLGMLNILGLTRFLQLGSIGGWPIVVAVGALPYPVTFLCTDLISELWGEEKANQVVWVGLLLNGWVLLILYSPLVIAIVEPSSIQSSSICCPGLESSVIFADCLFRITMIGAKTLSVLLKPLKRID